MPAIPIAIPRDSASAQVDSQEARAASRPASIAAARWCGSWDGLVTEHNRRRGITIGFSARRSCGRAGSHRLGARGGAKE